MELLTGLDEQLAHFLDICTVAYVYRHAHILVGAAAREVLEVLVKESGVGKGDNHLSHGLNLGGLVTDGSHLAADAVAFNHVAHPEASAHELDTINEVVDDILEGQTDTGTQAAGNEAQGPCRDVQRYNEQVCIDKPHKHADETVAQGEVNLIGANGLFLMFAEVAVVCEDLPQGVDGLVHVAEHQEHHRQEQDGINGNLKFALGEERLLEDGQVQVPEFEDAQRPIGTDGKRTERHQRYQDFTDEVIEPGGPEKQIVLVLPGHEGNLGAVGLQALVQPLFLVQEGQVPDREDGQDESQLEIPPYQDDKGQENIARQSDDDGNGRNDEGNPS